MGAISFYDPRPPKKGEEGNKKILKEKRIGEEDIDASELEKITFILVLAFIFLIYIWS